MRRPAKKPTRAPKEETAREEFTSRVLLSLIVEATEMQVTAKRVLVQVRTLAKAHGIKIPKAAVG